MTPRNAAPAEGAAGPGVQELIRQRELLAGWIAKLDAVKTDAPGRVTERVRADYEARLTQVTADLLAHRDEIERDLESRRGDQAAAEERRAHAADALEETQLRHMIGELDQGAWDESRPQLEGEVAAAEQALEQARGEVERLSALAAEIASAAEQKAPEPEPEPEVEAPMMVPVEPMATPPAESDTPAPAADESASSGEDLAAWISEVEAEASREGGPVTAADADSWDPFANEFGSAPASPATQPGDAKDELPWLDSTDGGGGAPPVAPAGETVLGEDAPPAAAEPAASGDLAADDLAFLEELDRAISGGAAAAAAPAEAPAFTGGSGDGFSLPPTGDDTRKKGETLLCKECGAINEPQAWYCEICGSEL